MNKKRKICVVTGTRAEYGSLYWLMKEIKAEKKLDLQVFATGMHRSDLKHGRLEPTLALPVAQAAGTTSNHIPMDRNWLWPPRPPRPPWNRTRLLR